MIFHFGELFVRFLPWTKDSGDSSHVIRWMTRFEQNKQRSWRMVLKINYSKETVEEADPRYCFVYFMAHAIGSKKFDVVYFGY